MIIENNKSQTVETYGETSSKKATISSSKLSKLQFMLTNGLYTDPASAVLVELCNNGMDAVIEAGKDPLKNPVIVKLFQDKQGQYQLSIEDKGIGMTKDFFENFFMDLLSSTKEDDNDTIGHFGIGGKSWASLNKAVNFTVTKDGKRCKFLCFKGEDFIEHELLKEEDTTEENGVLFEMQLSGYSEYREFCDKAVKKLTYYDTVALFIGGVMQENKIYRTEHFQWADKQPHHELHLCLKDVEYTLDYEKLGIPRIQIPIALRFGLDSGLAPTPSRESILLNKESIKIIKDKLAVVADYFVDLYNKSYAEFETFLEALPFIGDPQHHVMIKTTKFVINTIEQHSTIKPDPIKIKGVKVVKPMLLKGIGNDFFYEYTPIAYDDRGMWKKKHLYWNFKLQSEKVIICKDLVGNVKDYLRQKHGHYAVYVEKTGSFVLGRQSSQYTLVNMLQLANIPKANWRTHITEFKHVLKTLTDRFIDETDVENTKAYQDWLAKKKENQKELRKLGAAAPNYKGLDKQKGQITINKARAHSYESTAVFDRSVRDIAALYQHPRLSVYMEKDEALGMKGALYQWSKCFPNVDFVFIGEREIKYVKESKQFVTMSEFKETRPFARLATALLIADVLSACPNNEELIYSAFPKYEEMKEELKTYRELHGAGSSHSIHKIILDEAKATNNWDMRIHHKVLEFQEIIRKFGFVSYLRLNSGSEEVIRIGKNVMYVMLKHQKITGHDILDMELVPKMPDAVLEEMYADAEVVVEAEEEELVDG